MQNENEAKASPIGSLYLNLFELHYAISEEARLKAALAEATTQRHRTQDETARLYYQAYTAAHEAGQQLGDRILYDGYLFAFDEEGSCTYERFNAIQRMDLAWLAEKAGEDSIDSLRALRDGESADAQE